MALSLVLNRRQQVPAEDSPGFGAIAERFRRAGELERAVTLCQEGLQKYPSHLSSRVTLGWALLDLGRYEEARAELEQVLKRAPDNLAAIRGLAQLHDRTEHDDVASMQSHRPEPVVEHVAADFQLEDQLGTLSDPHDPHMIDPHAIATAGDVHAIEVHPAEPGAEAVPVFEPPLVFTPRQPAAGSDLATSVDQNEIDQLLEDADLSYTAPALELGGSWSDPAESTQPAQVSAEAPHHEIPLSSAPSHEAPSALLRSLASLRAEPEASAEVSAPSHEEPSELLRSFASLREAGAGSEPLRDEDYPWCNEGLVLTPPEPEPVPSRPTLQLVPASHAVDALELVADDGPGPWPPDPAMIDGVEAQLPDAPKESHWGPVRDVWPPVELRLTVRCAPPVAPDSPTADSHFTAAVAKPRPSGLKAALRRFKRRVDSRRRSVLSEYVAG